jgi:hypothetical protein
MAVLHEMQALLDDPQAYRRMSRIEDPYRFASRRIVAQLVGDKTGACRRSPGHDRESD